MLDPAAEATAPTDLTRPRWGLPDIDGDQIAAAGADERDVDRGAPVRFGLITPPATGTTGTIDGIISLAVSWARAQIGRTETPPGSNIVFAWDDVKPSWQGQPWCAAFVTDAYLRQGVDLRPLCTDQNPYYCPYLERMARARGVWTTSDPRAGDIVLYDMTRVGYATHTGIAAPDSTSYAGYRAIEGNTSSGMRGSQTNGIGVYLRDRPRTAIRGWIDMRALIAQLITEGKVKLPAAGAGAPGRPGASVSPTKTSTVHKTAAPIAVRALRPGQTSPDVARYKQAILAAHGPAYRAYLSKRWAGATWSPTWDAMAEEATRALYQALGAKAGDKPGHGWLEGDLSTPGRGLLEWLGFTVQ